MYALRLLSILGILILTYTALNIAYYKQAEVIPMANRKSVTYTFRGADEYGKHNGTVTSIIKEDTGVEHWRMNRMLPPTAYPPPLTIGAVDKLKELDGVIVEDVEEDVGGTK